MSGNTIATEAHRAETFAKDVADAMLVLRGYQNKTPPRDVVNDVFAEIAKADRSYTSCFAGGVSPTVTAKLIQDRIWGF